MAEITVYDYLLLPIYLWFIFKIAYYYRDKYYPEDHAYRPYFIPALAAKITGAIFIGLVYYYYYGGGDTFNYFFHSSVINSTFSQSPGTWFRLITHQADMNNPVDGVAVNDLWWYDDQSAYTTSCLGAFFGIFCFTKYLVINALIASVTFIGNWLMFVTFANQYPHLIKYIAIAVLFIPGPIVWGSGLFKDSFCLFATGCIVYVTYMLFEVREFKVSLLLLGLFSALLLILIKAYILIVLLPALVIKVMLVYKKKLSAHPEKKGIFYFAVSILMLTAVFMLRKAGQYLSNFNMENVLETIKQQKDYLLRVSQAQENSSGYDLGDFDPSLRGVVSKIVPAINVTLFRPYLWESHSIMQLFDAVQSASMLLVTLYLIFTRSIIKTLKLIYNDPNLIAFLFFTLIFAFFVGVSSYNFGTLSRYKIPCTPFFALFLVILLFGREKSTESEAENNNEAGEFAVIK